MSGRKRLHHLSARSTPLCDTWPFVDFADPRYRPPVHVRVASPDDAEGVARVHERAWRVGYAHVFDAEKLAARRVDVDRWRSMLEESMQRRTTFVADRGGRIIGFAAVGPSREEAAVGELYALYVDPEAWGEGAGRALIETAEERLAADGFREATLWVLEDNPRARRFYEAASWLVDGARKLDEHLETLVPEVRYRKVL
jgi:ribosomal protein S18 acetylase RimI-like enzyme